jgi:hypothetical protein
MSAAQRVSRGFHRLGMFLAAIPLIVGVMWSFIFAQGRADAAKMVHDEQVSLVCAQTALESALKSGTVKSMYSDVPPGYIANDEQVDLAQLGCSTSSWKLTIQRFRNARFGGHALAARNGPEERSPGRKPGASL